MILFCYDQWQYSNKRNIRWNMNLLRAWQDSALTRISSVGGVLSLVAVVLMTRRKATGQAVQDLAAAILKHIQIKLLKMWFLHLSIMYIFSHVGYRGEFPQPMTCHQKIKILSFKIWTAPRTYNDLCMYEIYVFDQFPAISQMLFSDFFGKR